MLTFFIVTSLHLKEGAPMKIMKKTRHVMSVVLCAIMLTILFPANMVSATETETSKDVYTILVGTDRHESTSGLKSTVSQAQAYVSETYGTQISKTVLG